MPSSSKKPKTFYKKIIPSNPKFMNSFKAKVLSTTIRKDCITPFDSNNSLISYNQPNIDENEKNNDISSYYFSEVTDRTFLSKQNLNELLEEDSLSQVNCASFSLCKNDSITQTYQKEKKIQCKRKCTNIKNIFYTFILLLILNILLMSIYLMKRIEEYKLNRILSITQKGFKFNYIYHNFSELSNYI